MPPSADPFPPKLTKRSADVVLTVVASQPSVLVVVKTRPVYALHAIGAVTRPLRLYPTFALIGAFATGCVGHVVDPPLGPGESRSTETESAILTPLARRLTSVEYQYTVQDVLGVTVPTDAAGSLPEDLPIGGFVNTAQGQATLPEHVLAYDTVARAVVSELNVDRFVDDHAPCRENEDACARGFVESAGRLLFRRPLEARELDDFSGLLMDVNAEEGEEFLDAAEATTIAMLQSPQFLYILVFDEEQPIGASRPLDGYEMASRLSYFIWRSAPDRELYRAAEAGELETEEGIVAQTRRMLADELRARRATDAFIRDWARLSVIPNADGLREELISSAVEYYQHFIWERDLPMLDTFVERSTRLTPALAEGYGLVARGEGIREYDLSAVEGRIGLLTHPGVVAGMTNADGGQIVARGLFLLNQLMCGTPPDPPANLSEIIDEFIAEQSEDASQREIADVRMARQGCGNCHARFDPLAFGFEQFDFRGRFLTEDEFGNVLQTDGWVPGFYTADRNQQSYATVVDLAERLRTNVTVRNCWVEQHVRYSLGSTVSTSARPAIERLANDWEGAGGSYSQLVERIVTSETFRRTAREAP